MNSSLIKQDWLDKKGDEAVQNNKDIYKPVYDQILTYALENESLEGLNKDNINHNSDLEILLTKVLTYSEFLGSKSSNNNVFKNANIPDISFSYDMPYDEAADYFERIHSINAKIFYQTLSRNAGRSFTISWVNSIETLEDIRKEFAVQMKDGFDPVKLKKFIQEKVISRGDDPLHPSHLENVVRTNVQTAFSKGRMQAQIELDKEYWQYYAVLDGRETELCHTLDGKVFKSTDPFWKKYYPPNHYQCRSTVVALDSDELEDDPEEDGLEYLKQSGLKNIEPGRGFQYSPMNSLDLHIQKKAEEHKIEIVKSKPPVFKKIKEAEEYLDKKYLSIFDFKGMDIKIINECLPYLEKIITKFKIKNIKYIGTNNKDKYPINYQKIRIPSCANACAYRINDFKFMLLKKDQFKDYESCQNNVKYNQYIKWSSGDNPTVARTMVHEFGHFVDYQYNLRFDEIIIDIFYKDRHSISEYGSKKLVEFIAEAFADVMTSNNPADASKKVYSRILEIAGIEE